jgi:hypothetical protein
MFFLIQFKKNYNYYLLIIKICLFSTLFSHSALSTSGKNTCELTNTNALEETKNTTYNNIHTIIMLRLTVHQVI